MSNKVISNGEFKVKTSHDAQATYFTTNEAGDFKISNPGRQTSGRALVPYNLGNSGVLIVNYGNDFSKVSINKLRKLTNIRQLPGHIERNTFDLVVDDQGNLYKRD